MTFKKDSIRMSQVLSHQSVVLPRLASSANLAIDADVERKEIEAALAQDSAMCIKSETQIMGMMAALLSSWGATLYAGERPHSDGLCYGLDVTRMTYRVLFLSLAFYFLCIASTLAILGGTTKETKDIYSKNQLYYY